MIYSFDCSAGVLQVVAGTLQCTDNGVMSVRPVSYAIDTSDPTTGFSDGMELGWGVVAAMAAAYGVHLLRRALFR